MAESIIGLYKTEFVKHDGPVRTVDDLELATISWVHWYNANRLHSALDPTWAKLVRTLVNGGQRLADVVG